MSNLALSESLRKGVWLFALTTILGAWHIDAAETNALRPNIVLILADDLGYSDLGCFGSEIATPNLDRLAARGMRLTQFYTTPRCCPSRASLLTGLYPQQAGIGSMMEDRGIPGYRGELNKNCPTIAEELRSAGYRTLMAGKWHVNHVHFSGKTQLNFDSNEPFWEDKSGWPLQRGFDEYFGTIHGVTSYYDPFSLVRGNNVIKPDPKDFYYTDALSDQAVSYIRQYASTNRPFFLYLSYTAPHWPLQAPEADIAKNRPTYLAGWDVIRSNRYERQLKMGVVKKEWQLSPRDSRVRSWSEVRDKAWEANRMATYAAMVEHVDRGVGRVLEALKTKGVDQNTLIVFFSDNGACAEVLDPGWYDIPSRTRDGRAIQVGNSNPAVLAGPETVWQSYGIAWANVSDTPFLLYKHFTHEGGIASPCIVSWPAVIQKQGSLNDQVGHVTDLMATCVDIAGAQHPTTLQGQSVPPLEGSSLLPILRGQERVRLTPLFWEHEGNRAVRLGDWKLVSRNHREWELYDLTNDRTELSNLASRKPEKVRELAALYESWATRCQVMPPDQLPPARPSMPARITN